MPPISCVDWRYLKCGGRACLQNEADMDYHRALAGASADDALGVTISEHEGSWASEGRSFGGAAKTMQATAKSRKHHGAYRNGL